MSKSDFFFCYDFGLQKKIKENGIPYITTAISNNGRRFWLFERTDTVNILIKEYQL
jgi:hypothetical protein